MSEKISHKIIPLNERNPRLESKVSEYLKGINIPPQNTEAYSRVKIPVFRDPIEKVRWELEEIRKCREGYKSMNSKQYFYFNYGWIKNITGGRIPPEYRVCDNDWYDHILEAQLSLEFGLVCVKKRRAGASWKEASDVVHDAIFNNNFVIGMNSKSEVDSIELFTKVKYVYDNLPAFLKVSTGAGNTMMSMLFARKSKDEFGNKVLKGNMSEIFVRPPTVSAFEGRMLNKWVSDESGKIDNLIQLYSYTEDCLMQETVRAGCPILFGTVGAIDRDGQGIKMFWDKSSVYKLNRFFVAGYNGMMVDKFGNDMIEDAIRWIVYERKLAEQKTKKEYADFLQRYPITPDEAFTISQVSGLGDPVIVNTHIEDLRANPARSSTGFFEMNGDKVIWRVHPNGPFKMYEDVDPDVEYDAGVDPVDHDNTTDEGSSISMYIGRGPHLGKPSQIVLEYYDKPKRATTAYNQCAMALMYYNNTKALIENNRYRMIGHFDEKGWMHLIAYTPATVTRIFGKRQMKPGMHVGTQEKSYIEGLIEKDIDNNYKQIPSLELMEEFRDYGSMNTDRAMAYGMYLVKLSSRIRFQNKEKKGKTIGFRYKRVNGNVVRVRE